MKRSRLDHAADLIRSAVGHRVEVIISPNGRLLLKSGTSPPAQFEILDWDGRDELLSGGAQPLWVLSRPTKRELERLRASGRSFVALSGAVRIDAPGLLLDREDLGPSKRATASETRSPFSDRSSRITRDLLCGSQDTEWTISSLAESSQVSPATVSYVVNELERRDLVAVRRIGRERRVKVSCHRNLFERWTQEYDWLSNPQRRMSAPVGSPMRFLRRLSRDLVGVRWAAGLHAGASYLVDQIDVEIVHLYIDVESAEDLDLLARRYGWPPADDGQLVLMRPHYRTSVWIGADTRDGIAVVSPLQLILDLWHYPLRGREIARILAERYLPMVVAGE